MPTAISAGIQLNSSASLITGFGALQPAIQVNDIRLGVRTNQFGFNIAWASGMTVVVDACTNPANPIWSPISTNTLSDGAFYFSDQQWLNYPVRFYRIRSP